MTLKLVLQGASGRAGSQVIKALPEYPELSLQAAIVAPDSPQLDTPLSSMFPGMEGRFLSPSVELFRGAAVCIDFSSVKGSLACAEMCAEAGVAHLVCTTGLEDADVVQLEKFSRHIPIVLAANTSLGIACLGALAKSAAAILGEKFDIELFEIHHNKKKDAPSGTAKSLARQIAEVRPLRITDDRRGLRAPDELGVSALRGGEVLGEHTVYFFGGGERIELTHRSTDKSVFARGALGMAPRIASLAPGFYYFQDLVLGSIEPSSKK